MSDQHDIDEFLFARDYSEQTRATYRNILGLLFISIPDPGEMDTVRFSNWLRGFEWAESTRYLAVCAVRSYLKWRYGAKHPVVAFRAKKISPPPQRTLTAAEADRLYWSFPMDDIGRRDLAMLSIFLDTGLRASEICRLRLEYLHLNENYLSVVVKGGGWMDKSFSMITTLDVDNWLSSRENHAKQGVGTVFVGIGGRTPGRPLTRDGLRVIVREWGERAGLGEPISPHAFRRSGATIGAENGASDQLLMQQFGWTSPQMVRMYTKRIQIRLFAENYSPVTKIRNG